MAKSQDLSLLERIKNGDQQAEVELYNKYIRLIHRRAHQAKCDHEDFVQEAFVCMRRATDYVKLDRITNPSSWGFYSTFDCFLMKHLYKVNHLAGREIATESSPPRSMTVGDRSFSLDSAYAHNLQFGSTFQKIGELDSQRFDMRIEQKYDEFVSSLTETHVKILHTYQEFRSVAATARQLNQAYSEVAREVRLLKKQAMVFFGVKEFA